MARRLAAASPGTRSRQDDRSPQSHRRPVDAVRARAVGLSLTLTLGYSPVKRGSRFSMNAISASAVSRDVNINACATSSDSIASAIV